jgi:hypothetical protein
MWQKLRFSILLAALAALMVVSVRYSVEQRRLRTEEQAANRLSFAQRLRDDGDRLAREGQWEDALARYDQAWPYDRDGDSKPEVQQKRQAMEEHLGEVVWDKEFERQGVEP